MPPRLGGIDYNLGRVFVSERTWGEPSNECFLSNAEIERIKEHILTTPRVQVKRIIFHDPATIVFWQDGTKTVVKCMPGQPYSEYYGFLAALAKKVYGSNSAVERIVREYSK